MVSWRHELSRDMTIVKQFNALPATSMPVSWCMHMHRLATDYQLLFDDKKMATVNYSTYHNGIIDVWWRKISRCKRLVEIPHGSTWSYTSWKLSIFIYIYCFFQLKSLTGSMNTNSWPDSWRAVDGMQHLTTPTPGLVAISNIYYILVILYIRYISKNSHTVNWRVVLK